MKLLPAFFTLLLISETVIAQKETPDLPIDSSTKLITYTGVVTVDPAFKKDFLYSRARAWFDTAYRYSNNIIQINDKENGKITGKEIMPVYEKSVLVGYFNYTISIFVKDGRYKYQATNFYHTGVFSVSNGTGGIQDYGPCEGMLHTKLKALLLSYQKHFTTWLVEMDTNMKRLVAGLHENMSSKIMVNQNDNW